jgi:hypothetical protein
VRSFKKNSYTAFVVEERAIAHASHNINNKNYEVACSELKKVIHNDLVKDALLIKIVESTLDNFSLTLASSAASEISDKTKQKECLLKVLEKINSSFIMTSQDVGIRDKCFLILAEAFYKIGEFDLALKTTVKDSWDHIDFQKKLCDHFLKNKKVDEAIEVLHKIKYSSNRQPFYNIILNHLVEKSDWVGAQKFIMTIEFSSDRDPLLIDLANKAFENGELEVVKSALIEIKYNKTANAIILKVANAYCDKDQPFKAIQCLEKFSFSIEERQLFIHKIGVKFIDKNNLQDVFGLFLYINNEYIKGAYCIELAKYCLSKNELGYAWLLISQVKKDLFKKDEVLIALARALLNKNNLGLAFEVVCSIQFAHSEKDAFLVIIANQYFDKGDFDQAKKAALKIFLDHFAKYALLDKINEKLNAQNKSNFYSKPNTPKMVAGLREDLVEPTGEHLKSITFCAKIRILKIITGYLV